MFLLRILKKFLFLIIVLSIIFICYLDLKNALKKNTNPDIFLQISKNLNESISNFKNSLDISASLLNSTTINNLRYINSEYNANYPVIETTKDASQFKINNIFCKDVLNFEFYKNKERLELKNEQFSSFDNLSDKFPNLDLALSLSELGKKQEFLSKKEDGIFVKYSLIISKIESKNQISEKMPKFYKTIKNINASRINCSSVLKIEYQIQNLNEEDIQDKKEITFNIKIKEAPFWLAKNLLHSFKGEQIEFFLKPEEINKNIKFFEMKKKIKTKDEYIVLIIKIKNVV